MKPSEIKAEASVEARMLKNQGRELNKLDIHELFASGNEILWQQAAQKFKGNGGSKTSVQMNFKQIPTVEMISRWS